MTGPASPSACDVCGAPTGDGARLCRTDQRTLAHALDELAHGGLLDDLDITRTRQDRITPTVRRGQGYDTERPLPWNQGAAGALAAAEATVAAWAHECHRHDPDDRDPLPTHGGLAPLAAWLRRALPILRHHDHAALAFDQITGVITRARRAVDLPRTISTFTVGPCPEHLDADAEHPGGPCEGTVYAVIGATDDAPSVMRCPACRRQWGTAEWLRAGRRILARQRALGHRASA